MTKEPDLVRQRVRHLVLCGYEPRQDADSEFDHDVDFGAISAEEFDRLYRQAKRDLGCRQHQEKN